MAKLEDVLSGYNQSNFDVAGAAKAMRTLGAKYGLTDDDLAASASVFGNFHKQQFGSGYTEGSNYNQIAQSAVQDALKAKGMDPARADDPNFIAAGAAEANNRWKATQEDDSGGFGSLVAMVIGGIAAANFGPLAGALTKAGFSLAGGADPLQVAASGGLSMLTGNLLGGAGGSDFVGDLPVDAGAVAGDGIQYTASGATSADTGTVNVTDGGIGDGTITGAPSNEQIDLGGNDATGSGASTADTLRAEDAITGTAGDSGGIVDRIFKALNENKGAAALAAGGLSAIGGVGNALLNKSTAEAKIQAEKERLSQETAEKLKADQNKRAMIQSGSYFDAAGTPAAAAPKPLRRPDGSLVFQNGGIIASRLPR